MMLSLKEYVVGFELFSIPACGLLLCLVVELLIIRKEMDLVIGQYIDKREGTFASTYEKTGHYFDQLFSAFTVTTDPRCRILHL